MSKLIKFDSSRAPENADAVIQRFNRIRGDIADRTQRHLFLHTPMEHQIAYKQNRHESELGRIFKTANALHNDIDAVVVIGDPDSLMGTKALFRACCDPYHNELSRGARGSKPRMYFVGNRLDNDSMTALLQRMEFGGHGDSLAERHWALVVIDKVGHTLETKIALQQLLPAIKRTLRDDENIGRYVIPITAEKSELWRAAQQWHCESVFDFPSFVRGARSIMNAATLLPAAMLGLDCIRFVEGAVEINQEFLNSDYKENMSMRYAAASGSLTDWFDRSLGCEADALEHLDSWYSLVRRDIFETNGKVHSPANQPPMVTSVMVERFRCDPLPVDARELGSDEFGKALTTLPKIYRTVAQTRSRSSRILLPSVDTYTMGQLMQMLMTASVLEAS